MSMSVIFTCKPHVSMTLGWWTIIYIYRYRYRYNMDCNLWWRKHSLYILY